MEIIKGNSKLVCLLEVGENIMIDKDWGGKIGGKKGFIEKIEHHPNCESGFMVKVSCYNGMLDANWLIKEPTKDKK